MNLIKPFSDGNLCGVSIVPVGDRDLIKLAFLNDPHQEFTISFGIEFSVVHPIYFVLEVAKFQFHVKILA